MGDRDSVEMYMGRTDRKVTTMKDDTISRAAVLDALNGLTKIFLNNLPPTIDRADAVEAIKALPSAQPEIIHCKDCKYNPNPPECGNAACVLFYGMTDQMGFCHHGERRERE